MAAIQTSPPRFRMCLGCKRLRVVDGAWRKHSGRNARGLPRCGECSRQANRERYVAAKATQKKYYTSKVVYLSERYQQRRQANPAIFIVERCRIRARKKGIPCSITEQDIFIPDYCPVLGIKLKLAVRGKPGPMGYSPSIDRIIPALGYVPGNVRIISHRANTLKNNASVAELTLVLADLKRLSIRKTG